MADNRVRYKRGAQAKYDATTKDSNTLYYCTDSSRFFLGSTEFSHPVLVSSTVPTTSTVAPVGTLLIYNSGSGNLGLYVKGSTTWELKGEIGRNTNLLNDVGKNSIKQAQDASYAGIKIKTKNPDAYALDNTLTDNETIGSLGDYSASFGGNTQAKGKRSFATGTGTIAKGGYSFSSGSDSVALGSASHVEGYRNTTGPSADSAHAEGGENIVTANRGHAEGYHNTVSGQDSHAEGGNNTVSGTQAHAEGLGNKATGNYSHAEGQSTEATGNQSHTEGAKTKAIGSASHVEGDTNEGHSYATHIEGSGNKVLTAISSSDTPGTGTPGTGGDPSDPNFNISEHLGANSHVEGTRNLMYGYSAHAEGGTNKVTGHYAHAEGAQNIVDAEAAHAEGASNIVNADATGSHVEGYGNTALGVYGHAEGQSNTVGARAHAEGNSNKAEAEGSHAEGTNNEATGANSHVEGFYTEASNTAAHAEGASTTASGTAAHAEGRRTKATGDYSHAEGEDAQATANTAHAGGTSTLASGEHSFAHGISSQAYHRGSVVFGEQVRSAGDNSFSIGQYNLGESENVFEVGIGTSQQRANALVVKWDGSATLKAQGDSVNSIIIKSTMDSAIAEKIASVYKAKGSVADISKLPTTLSSATEGFVYNIESAFTTTANFVEGAGQVYPAGTNVVCINTTGTTYKWDVLAGMVDLSGYVTTEDLANELAGKQGIITTSTNLVAGTVTAEAGKYLLTLNNNSIDLVDRLISLEKPSVSIAMSGYIAGSSVTPADVRFSSYAQITTVLQNPYVTLSGIANPTSNDQAANKKYVDDAIAAAAGGGGTSITVDTALSSTSTNPVQNKVVTSAVATKQDKFGTVSYSSSPKYLFLNINGYVDPTSGKFVQLSDSDITSTKITITSAEFQNKTTFLESLMLGTTLNGFNFELPTATTPGTIKTSNPNINKLNFSNGLGTSDIQLGGIKAPTADNDAANKKYVDTEVGKKQDKFASVSQPDPDGNVTWLSIDTPQLSIYNSTRKSSISMNNNEVELCNITGLVKLNINEKNIKFSKSANPDNSHSVSLLGVATPVEVADTTKDITADDLDYQAVNKKYADTKLAARTSNYDIAWDSDSEAIKITFHE